MRMTKMPSRKGKHWISFLRLTLVLVPLIFIRWTSPTQGSVFTNSPMQESSSFIGSAVAVDHEDSIIVVGETGSDDFPVRDAYDSTFNGKYDGFISKFSSTGILLWSTFLGGDDWEECINVAIDSANNIIVAGWTESRDFPTKNTPGITHNRGSVDAFVCKFSPQGSLLWSTILGGANSDYIGSVAVDSDDNIIVVGETHSADFPIRDAYDSTFSGVDVFVSKFSSEGSLLWSTFLGGSTYNSGKSVAVDLNDNIVIVGYTESSDFPTKSAYDSTFDGLTDVFVSKLSSTGNFLWSTFLGGNETEWRASVIVDHSDNIIVTGETGSGDFPTRDAYNSNPNGWADAFVSKFSSTGNLLWSTYLGGNDEDDGNSIAVDRENNIVIVGNTESADFPTKNAYDSTYHGDYGDIFVSKFSTGGSLLWSTFLGGYETEAFPSAAIDSANNIIVVGMTTSKDFPIKNAYDSTLNGWQDIFICKFALEGNLLWSTFLGGTDEYNESSSFLRLLIVVGVLAVSVVVIGLGYVIFRRK